MKSSKLIDIFKTGNIVIPIYILKNYKKWNITLEEFIFLMYLYSLGNKFLFNPNEFSKKLDITLENIMKMIATLTEKNFIKVEVIKNDKGIMEEVIIMDGFFQKLSYLAVDDINKDEKAVDSNIFEIIEQEFARTLSPMEYEIIKAWLDNKIDEKVIREAIKEASFSGVSNLRYIDKILYEWTKVGVKNIEDINKIRKKKKKKESSQPVDLEIMDWNWFDDEDE